jgi:hypothetical protein
MRLHIKIVCGLMAVCVVAATGWTQEPLTENTLRLAEGASSPPAEISDVSWLSGYWRGTGFGGDLEEIWSRPAGDRMHGIFTLATGGKPVFSEAMQLVEEDGSLVLKVKHFNPDFTGWEEKDDFVRFRLVRLSENEAYFHGLTFRRNSDTLVISIVMTRDGERTEHELAFERIPF